jgi:hypothetical protein
MHPVITLKTWAHVHHVDSRHEMADRLSQWVHGEDFWPVMGVILALTMMAVLVYMAVLFAPLNGADAMYSSPSYLWMH